VWGLLGVAGKDPRHTEAAVGIIDFYYQVYHVRWEI
jgi:hypothetical protein